MVSYDQRKKKWEIVKCTQHNVLMPQQEEVCPVFLVFSFCSPLLQVKNVHHCVNWRDCTQIFMIYSTHSSAKHTALTGGLIVGVWHTLANCSPGSNPNRMRSPGYLHVYQNHSSTLKKNPSNRHKLLLSYVNNAPNQWSTLWCFEWQQWHPLSSGRFKTHNQTYTCGSAMSTTRWFKFHPHGHGETITALRS